MSFCIRLIQQNEWFLLHIVLFILNNHQTLLSCLILSSSLDNGHLMQIPLSLVSTLPQLQDSGDVKENCNAMGYKL